MKSTILLIFFVIVKCDEYLELLKSTVGVRILPLRIDVNSTELVGHPVCRLTVHKNTCTAPSISFNDTISWSTKVCFQWRCNALDHAMRISNCWIGTTKNPVYLIRSNGCTTESALLRTPSYLSFQRAISIGWLTVREVGMKNIYIQCDITLCHFCDPYCQESTPPRKCAEVSNQTVDNYDRMWNSSKAVDKLCNPVIELEPTSTSYLSISISARRVCFRYALTVINQIILSMLIPWVLGAKPTQKLHKHQNLSVHFQLLLPLSLMILWTAAWF